ncbi:MAG: electron transfer flavoprotein subunit alpha/FixB family protein [Candidatus Krumholzibacteriia bacterium]
MPNIAVFIEQRDGQVRKVAWQMIAEARRLVDQAGGEVWGVHLHAAACDTARQAGAHGAHRLFTAQHDLFRLYDSAAWTAAVVAFAREQKPDLILIGATALGKDLAPKVAQRLGAACISDSVALRYDGGAFEVRRPIYAGKCFVDVVPQTSPAVVAVRPNAFALGAGDGAAVAETPFAPGVDGGGPRARVVEVQATEGRKIELTEAEVVVSGGRGIKGPEHYHLIEELAASLGAAAGASRAIVDAGWVPHANQVGQTGKTVSPKLYVACGISGAIQHLAGMSSSKCIVAINKDPNAPIFKVADYGIVGDLFQIVPALQAEIGKLKS